MTTPDLLLAGLTLAVMLVGVVGVVVPVVPDVWLIWLAAAGYGLLQRPLFDGWIGGLAMLPLTGLAVLGIAIDLVLAPAAAARGGASGWAIVASIALGLVGLFVYPIIGPLVGALLGLFLVEYQRRGRDARQAWEAVKHYALGCGGSVLLRLLLALGMVAVWAVWVLLAHT